MPAPTSEDAHLYLQLLQATQAPGFLEAREFVARTLDVKTLKDLDSAHPLGSAERTKLLRVLDLFESAGALVSRGLLHEDVFFDAPFGFPEVWPRVEPLVLDWQKASRDEARWENLVWLARRYERWRKDNWRPKLEAIPTDRPPTKVWGEAGGHVGFTKS